MQTIRLCFTLLIPMLPMGRYPVMAQHTPTTDSIVGTSVKKGFASKVCDYWNRITALKETDNPIRYRTSLLGIGGLIQHDSYLSPLNYGGYRASLMSETYTPLSKPLLGTSLRRFAAELDAGMTLNPAQNAIYYSIFGNVYGSYLYKWSPVKQLHLFGGPGLRLGTGGVWSTRNGNNPGTLRLYSDMMAEGMITYRLPSERWGLLFRLSDAVSLLGVGFSQEYGESYYERFILNTQGRITDRLYMRHPGSGFSNRLMLTVDIPLLDYATMVVGYRHAYEFSNMNQIHTHETSHSLLIGFSILTQNLRGRKNHIRYSPL